MNQCRIGIVHNHQIQSVAVRYDGSIHQMGPELLTLFNTVDKALALLNGEIQSIEQGRIERFGATSTAYQIDFNVKNFVERAEREASFFYYILEHNTWYCGDVDGSSPISFTCTPLEEALVLSPSTWTIS